MTMYKQIVIMLRAFIILNSGILVLYGCENAQINTWITNDPDDRNNVQNTDDSEDNNNSDNIKPNEDDSESNTKTTDDLDPDDSTNDNTDTATDESGDTQDTSDDNDSDGKDSIGDSDIEQHTDPFGDTESSFDTDTLKDSEISDEDSDVTFDTGLTDTDKDKDTDTENKKPVNCGDGILTADEACDDANNDDGDGCSADCLTVTDGYSCNPPGRPCQKIARCGDGAVSFPELCDDNNTESGDGCSSVCKIEIGYKCDGSPSECTPTLCGDGKIEGAEACDDGNIFPYDGCDFFCQTEPDCSAGRCVSECGDGLVIDEECDDGNTVDGDGCSSVCNVEDGYVCTQDEACLQINGECVLDIKAVFRDFSSYADSLGDFSGGGNMIEGLVERFLDNDGKPAAVSDVNSISSGTIASPESFARWYRNSPTIEAKVGSILLFDNGRGGYVNRWGKEGEQWCVNDTCYDGSPVFFPVDDLSEGADFVEATIPPEYGGNWQLESDFVPDASKHNFGYTTEVKYWFLYDETQTATLEFLGDDDLWVFVNGRLALDLGNPHTPLEGNVTVNAASANTYNLANGGVYAIQVFHAERNPTGSSFKLTLSGFNASRSLCLSVCGDGIVGLGEECDDGINDGGYGECYPGCVLGEYCGDRIVQENEDCDDGNTLDGDDCPSSCRNVIIL